MPGKDRKWSVEEEQNSVSKYQVTRKLNDLLKHDYKGKYRQKKPTRMFLVCGEHISKTSLVFENHATLQRLLVSRPHCHLGTTRAGRNMLFHGSVCRSRMVPSPILGTVPFAAAVFITDVAAEE